MVNLTARPLVCQGCRSRIIQSFAAAFFDTPPHTRSQPQRFLPVARSFTHGRSMLADERAEVPSSSHVTQNDILDSSSKSDPRLDASSSSTNSTLPWYLQVSTPTPPPSSSHQPPPRDLLPELPSNPHPILSPILSHLSIDLGLDSLTLLDLRSLTNPPPALGANLLMIIGTARSIKHLNVSADRLCRWLRSEYKLRPYADGLLGRQELKVKLRRRERRRRMKASVGNLMGGMENERGGDDGITTGWICVNVGQVEDKIGVEQADESDQAVAGAERDLKEEDQEQEYINPPTSSEAAEEEPEEQDPDPTYIGFGSRSNASRIVVQMFTEEKRAELDLEGLWQDRATRRTRKAERNDEEAEAAVERREQKTDEEVGLSSMIAGIGRQVDSSGSGDERAAAGG